MGLLLSPPSGFEAYGAVRVFEEARVLGLDVASGKAGGLLVGRGELEDYGSRTAIVVPVKDEDPLTLENVLRAIPTVSPLVVVSASTREPLDNYRGELELAEMIGRSLGRKIVVVHQFDPAWGEALEGTSLEDMLEDGKVRGGKGEGMILGVLLAAWLGADYVGFIDSDNWVPGSATEYSWIYYSGFALARSRYPMVRLIWPYKGKLATGDVYLRRRGRVSRHTNALLNMILTRMRRIETDIVKTGNAGEHAMSIKLALSMDWAGGFAVEPYQLVWLLENCGPVAGLGECPALPDTVEVYQIEALNPHIHAERGDEHIAGMLAKSIGVIYHSRLAWDELRREALRRLREQGYEGEPPKPRVYQVRGVDPSKIVEKFLAASRDALLLN